MLSNPTPQPATRVDAALAKIEAGFRELRDAGFDELATNPQRVVVTQRLETIGRTVPGFVYPLINTIERQWRCGELGDDNVANTLADALRISPSEARTRIRIADDLSPQVTFSGARRNPTYPATAAAVADGAIGDEHVKVIREFFRHVRLDVENETAELAEQKLAEQARVLRPDQLRTAANRILGYLNPDGPAAGSRTGA
ncbi:DUF222 domain-containing protein [Antrihabitans sp. YC3-6]|uniref:DUF222 domain-containing protein n=1 Tax=Antrihabitans stalagmiti TaxID=2799499 RepID=A0A934NPF8_9NOCA|nr:DUF222 domain-containing protein [Antrihabitans stalagmiti]MBJ8338948.1 DUF222 domain-containing protein [Antrihabitans stalagmiti]